MDVLENTLWNRQLGVMSEEIVAALVCQIFEGEAGAHAACRHRDVRRSILVGASSDHWRSEQ